MPEIDLPAHSASWGLSEELAGVLANCSGLLNLAPGDRWKKMDKLSLDPTSNLTLHVLRNVIDEVARLFPDPYMHLVRLVSATFRRYSMVSCTSDHT